MAHHQLHPLGLGGLDHGVAFGQVHGHRLFAEDVFAGFGGGDGHGGVQVVGSEQGHRRRPALRQAPLERGVGRDPEPAPQRQRFLRIRIADGADPKAGKPPQQIRHLPPKAAASHDRNRQAVHDLNPAPRPAHPPRPQGTVEDRNAPLGPFRATCNGGAGGSPGRLDLPPDNINNEWLRMLWTAPGIVNQPPGGSSSGPPVTVRPVIGVTGVST